MLRFKQEPRLALSPSSPLHRSPQQPLLYVVWVFSPLLPQLIIPSEFQNIVGRVAASITSFIWPPNDNLWYPFLNRMAATGKPIDQLLGNILGVAVGASVNHGHAAVNVVDFYLDDARKKERDHIVRS